MLSRRCHVETCSTMRETSLVNFVQGLAYVLLEKCEQSLLQASLAPASIIRAAHSHDRVPQGPPPGDRSIPTGVSRNRAWPTLSRLPLAASEPLCDDRACGSSSNEVGHLAGAQSHLHLSLRNPAPSNKVCAGIAVERAMVIPQSLLAHTVHGGSSQRGASAIRCRPRCAIPGVESPSSCALAPSAHVRQHLESIPKLREWSLKPVLRSMMRGIAAVRLSAL